MFNNPYLTTGRQGTPMSDDEQRRSIQTEADWYNAHPDRKNEIRSSPYLTLDSSGNVAISPSWKPSSKAMKFDPSEPINFAGGGSLPSTGGGYRPPGQGAWRGNEPFQPDVQPPTAGGAQPPLPWQQPIMPPQGMWGTPWQQPMSQQSILPQQPTIGQEDRSRPWQTTPTMSFNLRTPMSMQPNWRQAWNWQQPQQQQQQLPSMQAPLRTSTISSYDWTS